MSSHSSPQHPSGPLSARSTRKKLHSRGSSTLPLTPLPLSSVLGHTSHSPSSHSLSPQGDVAYIAGNTLLLYSHRTHLTRPLLTGRPSHLLSSCAFSPDGSLIATGESSASSPALCVYDAQTGERRGLVEGVHAHSIQAIRWHTTLPSLLLTLGEGDAPTGGSDGLTRPYTSELAMTDWRAGEDRASAVVYCEAMDDAVHSLGVSEDGTYAVTCGERSLTFFHLHLYADDGRALAALDGRRLSVERQEAKLGVHKSATFVSLACGQSSTAAYVYALTNRGVLCAFTQKDRKRAGGSTSPPLAPPARSAWELEKWVDLRLDTGFDLTMASAGSSALLAIAGAEGKIRLFEPDQLQHVATLPRPQPYVYAAGVGVGAGGGGAGQAAAPGTFPPTLAVSLFPDLTKLLAFYADRSMVLWDIRQPKERPIGVLRSFTGHGGCIWDVQSVDRRRGGETVKAEEESKEGKEREREGEKERRDRERRQLIPDSTLITCAADNSLRFWHLNRDVVAQAKLNAGDRTRWSDQQIACIHVTDAAPATAGASPAIAPGAGAGIKCLLSLSSHTASPRSDLLVTGDKQGVIRVYSLTTLTMVASVQASDKEIKCLDYHAARDVLIAGTRDGHLHLYDLSTLSSPAVHTLPLAHSSAITGVKVTTRGLLISISADKSLIFRLAPPAPSPPYTVSASSYPQVSRTVLKTGTPHALLLHPSEKFVAVATSDRWIRVFDLATYKETRQYRVECGGEMTAMTADVSGTFIAIGCSDKCVYMVEWFSGSVLAVLTGHGSVVTAVTWSDDSSKLVSVGADGCVFVWKVDDRWTAVIKEATKRAKRSSLNASSTSANGLNSARRRRSALDYLDDDAEVTSDSVATSMTTTSEMDLLDDEDREERKAPDTAAIIPSPPTRPSPVPPLALPLFEEQKEARDHPAPQYKPSSAPDWAKTQSQGSPPISAPASNAASPSSSADAAPAPATGREPKTSRWSLRAQSGYKMVSELDREGVEVTPAHATERRDNLTDTGDAAKKDGEPAPDAAHADDEIEEELTVEGAHRSPPRKGSDPATGRPQVVRADADEIEEELQSDADAKREVALPGALSPSPSSSSPPLPPRPSISLLKSPALTGEDAKGAFSPLISIPAGALAVPPLNSSTAGPPSNPTSPALPSRRASQPSSRPSSRSSSRPTSPYTKAVVSPAAPPRTLLPATLEGEGAEGSGGVQPLQALLTRTLAVYQQMKAQPLSPACTAVEEALQGMYEQLGQALPRRGEPRSQVTLAAGDELSALERYSEQLVQLVMKKLDGKGLQ